MSINVNQCQVEKSITGAINACAELASSLHWPVVWKGRKWMPCPSLRMTRHRIVPTATQAGCSPLVHSRKPCPFTFWSEWGRRCKDVSTARSWCAHRWKGRPRKAMEAHVQAGDSWIADCSDAALFDLFMLGSLALEERNDQKSLVLKNISVQKASQGLFAQHDDLDKLKDSVGDRLPEVADRVVEYITLCRVAGRQHGSTPAPKDVLKCSKAIGAWIRSCCFFGGWGSRNHQVG